MKMQDLLTYQPVSEGDALAFIDRLHSYAEEVRDVAANCTDRQTAYVMRGRAVALARRAAAVREYWDLEG